ncbi:High-affinity branched-chain amino acid transport ATP-binding protein BraF [Burkholderiales bacterium 8X]|nr:High-affinity branched-chain amino acid transport ATP-binding protein BraF [Burkholderiales bacterium 8X]
MSQPILEVSGLHKFFGGVPAISNLSFSTMPGEILGIIGPNGSGKTTMFNVITGVLAASSGSIRFRGESIAGLATDAIARRGLVRTFQSATVFKRETAFENVRRSGVFACIGRPTWFFRKGVVAEGAARARDMASELLEFAGLSDVSDTLAGNLPYGKQKMLGVLIALAQRPTQLLMDEPAAGLNTAETEVMGELIAQIRSMRGVDVVLVEHDIKMVTRVCDRILALNYGKTIVIDVPEKVVAHPEVIEAYLGAGFD